MKRGVMALAALAAAGLTLAAPAQAQFRSDGSRFLEAVEKRDGDTAMEMLSEPGNTLVNARDITSGRNALHIVTARRDLTWLQFLLQRGANPNIADKAGTTPLQIAARIGFIEGVEALAKGGASIDVADATGETPLIAAVHRRDLATVRALVERGASSRRADSSGRTARDYAALAGAAAIIEIFDAADNAKANSAGTYGPG